jgi:GT2 family glycosyltransferase
MSELDLTRGEASAGLVSVVIVNYRGAADTIQCLAGLGALDWPAERLEIVVVDNASGDGSAQRIRAAAPGVRVIESKKNTGFAGGCNLGVARSTGDYIAFINSDARPDPRWLSEAVAVLKADSTVGVVACKVVDWDGNKIDFVDGHVNFTGHGYKLEAGKDDTGEWDSAKDVLFATGSAMVARADTFRRVGGFDEQFFMFFEDVDLGWRMNLFGYRVRYVPESLVFHKHHAAIERFGSFREHYLLERNALLTIYKNLDEEGLRRALAPALLLAIHNAVLLGGADPFSLDLQRSPGGDEDDYQSVHKLTMTGVYAVDYLARNLGQLEEQRKAIQRQRVLTDRMIPGLSSGMLQPVSAFPSYLKAWNKAVDVFALSELYSTRRRILVLTADTLAPQMAGPAIRAFNIANELAGEHEVKLISTTACSIEHPRFSCAHKTTDRLHGDVDWADIVIFQGFVLHHAPWIAQTNKIVVVDIYDPMHLEQLEQTRGEKPDERAHMIAMTTEIINDQLRRGDFFMCASEEQRHFWLGQLAGVGRLNPGNYDRDSSLDSLLAVCPFGMSSKDPVRKRRAIKGVMPGISRTDKVIIWAGGVYNWFDPLTLILAVDQVRREHDDVRLFFLGMKHPNPNVPHMQMAWEAKELSDGLGLTDKYVFFNETWVEYDDRQNYLLDSDLGVSTHFLHVETTFSFRTRMLDYLWARLPIVATEGDLFGRMIAAEGLGVTVPERDADALAEALARALYDKEFVAECRENVVRVRQRFVWDRTLAPLANFCRNAMPAADSTRLSAIIPAVAPVVEPAIPSGRVRRNVYYARERFREGGTKAVARHGVAKARRLVVSRLR